MRAPLSWLRDFVPALDAEPDDIATSFDNLGFEVDALDVPGRGIAGVIVAEILAVLPHPNADKLRLADVDFGSGTTRVVCGAPNIMAGMVVPFAPSGATLPGGFTLERRTIRGEVSDGMLCSARELGLGDDHAGILALAVDAERGADVRDVLGLHDAIFDLAITPNRPDAMSIVGLARELAARYRLDLVVPDPVVPPAAIRAGLPTVTVEIDDVVRAPRYLGRVAAVTLGPSPEWMARRLTLAGVRPISNVVDVTNYVLLERGQPLHAFDLDRLAGPGVVVRTAAVGEKITTLDGAERALTAEELLICDTAGAPQAIAGIMGGGPAEVTEATRRVLLESANFQAVGISKSSKRLGLRSESSARFERGTDPDGVETAATRALELLVTVAGAEVSDATVDIYPHPIAPVEVRVHRDRVNALLGTELDDVSVIDALVPLGIGIATEAPGVFIATAPSFRPDLTREVDVIEEVARRVGFHTIPRTLPDTTGHTGGLTTRQRERRLLADLLVGLGGYEATTLSLLAPEDTAAFGFGPDATVRAANPLRADESVLRPRLVPGLLRAVAFNAAHGRPDVSLFELGAVFLPPGAGSELPDEREHAAFVLAGTLRRTPVEADRPVDVYDIVDRVRSLVDAFELADARLEPSTAPGFHPGRTAALLVDGVVAGYVGEIDPDVAAAIDIPGPVVAAELAVPELLDGVRRDRAFRPLSRFPASNVDLAFVVDVSVPAASIITTLEGALEPELESVRVFDEYRDEALGDRRRSLAFALHFRAADRTLTDAEVATLRTRGIDAVVAAHGAELRG